MNDKMSLHNQTYTDPRTGQTMMSMRDANGNHEKGQKMYAENQQVFGQTPMERQQVAMLAQQQQAFQNQQMEVLRDNLKNQI